MPLSTAPGRDLALASRGGVWYRFHVRIQLASAASLLALIAGFGACSGEPPRTGCPAGKRYVKQQCLADYDVRLSTVGFLPARRKAATFRGESAAFTVRKAEDDTEVFSGTADGPRANGDTAEQVYVADFSELQEPRSEERRVGKECRSRASPWQQRNRQTTA